MPADEARLRLWRSCGGPIDEIPTLLNVLTGAELVTFEHGQFRRSRAGQQVLAQRQREGLRPLGLALLRTGYFYDQARVLLDLGQSDPDGSLSCGARTARRNCPQLVGLLQHWADVPVTPILRVPTHILRELEAAWALLPPPTPGEPTSETIRKSIGNRGELYSYQLERLKAHVRSNIVWVARDDNDLGYDLEDRSTTPRRRIEAKASGGTVVRFFLSDNEWREAHANPSSYEIHFWGGVDTNTQPTDEFHRLRALGYPLVFTNLPTWLSSGQIEATPVKWRISHM